MVHVFEKVLYLKSLIFQGSSQGNCKDLDDTALVQCGSSTYVPPVKGQDSLDDPFEAEYLANSDHSYTSKGINLDGTVVANCVVYIAGWVVRKLMTKIDCDECREALVTCNISEQYKSSSHLLRLKQNGGLVVPSDPVIRVLLLTEQQLRHIGDVKHPSASLTCLRLERNVMSLAGQDTLCSSSHALATQVGIDNHHFSLMRLLVSTYYKVRVYHIVKLHNEFVQGARVRHNLTKTILFKGQ